jgi:ATP-dependent RNA helicase DeaD
LRKLFFMTFAELGLRDELMQAVADLGFTEPTPVQQGSIPQLLAGTKDFVGLAQTGTGKTAAFGLPLLHLVNHDTKNPQALIMCPTRELCMQIMKDLVNYKKYIDNSYVAAVYGGTSISQQIRDLKKGVQIVVATPGRLIDLIERGAINLEEIQYVVLDEADEMLNMGFQDDIEFILKNTPNKNASWLFSATMPAEIRKVAKKYMTDPFEFSAGKVNTTNVNIDHQYYPVAHRHRYEALKRLIDFNPGIYGIIFTQTRLDAQEVAEKLTREGYEIDALHGDLTQQQRDKVMRAFREKSLQLLIATDVAARGIDVKEITHVINYELPQDIESYTHRSGRTGRAGNTGICMSIVAPREMGKIKDIERITKCNFHRLELPSGTEVCRKQFMFYMDKIHNTDISRPDYKLYLDLVKEKFEDMDKEEILQRVAALEFDRFLTYYENAEDLNPRADRINEKRAERRGDKGEGSGERRERGERSAVASNPNAKRLFINLGTKDGFYKASFLQFVLDHSELTKDVVGQIEMKDMFSFIEVEKGDYQTMITALDGKSFKGRKIRMNEAENLGARFGSGEGGGRGRRRDSERSSGGSGERRSYGGGSREGGERRSYGGDGSGGGERRSREGGSRGSYGGNREDRGGSSRGGSSRGGSSRGGGDRDRGGDGMRKRRS